MNKTDSSLPPPPPPPPPPYKHILSPPPPPFLNKKCLFDSYIPRTEGSGDVMVLRQSRPPPAMVLMR